MTTLASARDARAKAKGGSQMLEDFLARTGTVEAETPQLTQGEMRALRAFMRRQGERLEDDMTPFSAEERRRLTFLRWLHSEGRLAA